ncbi:sulfotransferase [Brevundimonas sp. TWP2-3-4b1]|uniref:sulfotransferase n=1 Tax=Brevundimonas sp. TWP2-3-4b1 TaxID=2804580 RepID=UPI003CEE0377
MTGTMVINIGWARAASTALRQNFLARHPDIVTAGSDQRVDEGPAATILSVLKTADDDEFRHRAPALRDLWDDYRRKTDGPVCLSDEELSIGLPGRTRPVVVARRCAELFPEARILAVVREPVDAIGSFYGLAQRETFRDPTPFPDWLDRYFLAPSDGAGFAYLYAHGETLTAWGAGRPQANMMVLDYRRLRTDPTGAYANIARWLAVSEAACEALPNSIVNASPAGPPTWPADRAAAIRALYDADNRILAETWGVDFNQSAIGDALLTDAV